MTKPRVKALTFTVDAKAVRAAIERVSKAAGSKSSVKVLTGVHLSVEDDELVVWCTDMDLCLREQVPVTKASGDPCAVPNVAKLVTALKTLDGQVTCKTKDGKLEVTDTEGTTITFETLPADDFPAYPYTRARGKGERHTAGVAVTFDDLAELMRMVGRCASKDESRPVLQGVRLERTDDGHLMGITTNSYMLALDTCGTGPGEFVDMLVPSSDVTRTLKFMAGEKILTVQQRIEKVGEEDQARNLYVSSGRRQACMRVVDGQFPNWRQLIPENWEATVTVESKPLAKALARIKTLASVNAPARLHPQNGKLLVWYDGRADEPGVRSEMPATTESRDPIRDAYGMNPGFLYDALDGFDETLVQLNLINPLRPVTVTDAGWSPDKQPLPDRCYLIMPIRLSS